jgi:putative flippase GtrA
VIGWQLFSFAVIGISVNAALYAVYLLLTYAVMGSRSAMTITYCAGVLISFTLNRRITFRFRGNNSSTLLRYVGAYVLGYAINLAGLWLLVDHFGIAHEIAQGEIMAVLVVVLFLLLRYWVFPARASPYPARSLRSVP